VDFEFITSDQSDISVNPISKLNTIFNLSGNQFEATNRFVNKIEMRELAKRLNIPIPNFAKIFSYEQLLEFINNNGLPIIIKPADSQSSRGVAKIDVDNIDQVEHFVINSLKYSNCGYLIAEDYVEGYEVTVEGIASNYKHRTLAVSLKKHFRTGIASKLQYPANVPDDMYSELERLTDLFVEGSYLRFGITHAEYIVNLEEKEIKLIEIACRGGGTLISSDIVNWVSGVNIYDIYYANLQGGITDVKNLNVEKKPAVLQFFEFKQGKVKSIKGIEDIKKMQSVKSFALNFKPGDELLPAYDDRSRQGYFIAIAETNKELEETVNKVLHTIEVKYE
jgi:biotin carboxylase